MLEDFLVSESRKTKVLLKETHERNGTNFRQRSVKDEKKHLN